MSYATATAKLYSRTGSTSMVKFLVMTRPARFCFGSLGITDDSRFIERALSTIREFMEDDGQQFAYRKFIAPASGTVSFAKALNRSVTGSMNELVMETQMYLVEDGISPHEVGFKLNGILLSTLKNAEGRKYAEPRDAFKRLGSHPTVRIVGLPAPEFSIPSPILP